MPLRTSALVAALVCATACTTTPPRSAETRAQAPADHPLHACFDAQMEATPFSGVVLVENEDGLFVGTAGHADLDGNIPITRDTRFRLASVTKLITRAAVGRLVDEGRIDLDAPVARYVEGLPSDIAAVTIEQLLDHRSGVPNLRHIDDDAYVRFAAARTETERLPFILATPLEFAPGTEERYSNGGFILLGIVIEAVTEQSYSDFVRSAVYRPLGMDASSSEADAQTTLHLTLAPGPDGVPRLVQGAQPDRHGGASGDTVSTVDDLLVFGRALLDDAFLSPRTREEVFQHDMPFTIFHDGATAGVETGFIAHEDPRTILVMLANRDRPAGQLMARALLGGLGLMGDSCTPMRQEDLG